MKRDARGRFQKGTGGRPKGARNRTTLAVQQLLDGDAKRLTRRAIKLALEGHPVALKLVLERIAPLPRDRMIIVGLPSLEEAADAPAALAAICAAVGAGEVTPAEGSALAALVGEWRAAIETTDLAERVAVLEAAAGSAAR